MRHILSSDRGLLTRSLRQASHPADPGPRNGQSSRIPRVWEAHAAISVAAAICKHGRDPRQANHGIDEKLVIRNRPILPLLPLTRLRASDSFHTLVLESKELKAWGWPVFT